ncbi:MAG: VTT domain-containing protein [Gemmatimonadales bacterium]|nr:VTT domain-containing protein [Gemmatimonadales bacterium]
MEKRHPNGKSSAQKTLQPTGAPPNGKNPIRQLLLPLLVLLGFILLGNWLGGRWPEVEAALEGMGAWGYVVYSLAFVLLTSMCFPVSVLGISAGFLFGPWLGFGLHFLSGVLASSLMYWFGKGLLRTRIKSLLATRPRLAAVDRMVGERAIRLNLLVRLSPMNYGVVCYTLASGRNTFGAYAVGMLGNAPTMAAQIWIGVVARQTGQMGSGDLDGSPQRLILLGVGLVFFALLSWQISRMVQAAWKEIEPEPGSVSSERGTDEPAD